MFGCCSDMGYQAAAQNCLSMQSIVCYCYCKIIGWKVKKSIKLYLVVTSVLIKISVSFFFAATSDWLFSLVSLPACLWWIRCNIIISFTDYIKVRNDFINHTNIALISIHKLSSRWRQQAPSKPQMTQFVHNLSQRNTSKRTINRA